MHVDRESISENDLREVLITIDDQYDIFCTETIPIGRGPGDRRPWGLNLGQDHPRYREIMRELSDGVMAAYIRKTILKESGQTRWVESYAPNTGYFLDMMTATFGHEPTKCISGSSNAPSLTTS
eukprot:6623516-Karenia_brevis.AAC.1